MKQPQDTLRSHIFRCISLFLSLTLIFATLPLSAQKAPSPAPAKTAGSPKGSAPLDPGWPRQKSSPAGELVLYQPHIDEWKDFRVPGRMAISLTLAGSKTPMPGVVYLQAQTDANLETHLVLLHDLEITQTHFPSQDAATAAKLEQAVRVLPSSIVGRVGIRI